VQASENKTPDVINRIMAEPVHNLSLMDADPQGTLRWVVWQEGQADSRASYLALYQQAKGLHHRYGQQAGRMPGHLRCTLCLNGAGKEMLFWP
jgi:hypothetical protein